MTAKRAHSVAEMLEGSAWCRAFGHAWGDPHKDAYGGRGRKAGWAFTLICQTCATEKYFKLSRRGELTAPRYVYPDGYLVSFFIGPEERGAFRLEALGLPSDSPHLRIVEEGA